MNTYNRRRVLLGIASAVTVAALLVPGAALGKGTPGGGGGQGGHPGGETATNNLSVPAVFLGSNPYGLTCTGDAAAPTGTPLTGYYVDPAVYFYVQGVHKWQAGCVQGASVATAEGAWGDNLSGDAKLKVGSPIRVEMGLMASSVDGAGVPAMTGWTVEKLENTLDRLSAYGTRATALGDGTFTSSPQTPYPETRVWANGAWLKIYPLGSPESPVVNQAAGAEINSAGRVVYGYNLRVAAAGKYVIEYRFPNVGITGVDAGTFEGDTVSLTIEVIAGGGGGGRRR